MAREYLPLDAAVSAYEWNKHAVCVNPALFFSHRAGPRDSVEIRVAARLDPSTGKVRWYAASDYEYKDGGGGALPSLGSRNGLAPPLESMHAAAFDEIESLLKRHADCWHPLFSPTAEKKLQQQLQQRRVGVQASLF